MIGVQVITRSAHGPIKAVVEDTEAGVCIMCSLCEDGWEPLYGVRRDSDDILSLPGCFELSEEIRVALMACR